jgi:hypothetical protein
MPFSSPFASCRGHDENDSVRSTLHDAQLHRLKLIATLQTDQQVR